MKNFKNKAIGCFVAILLLSSVIVVPVSAAGIQPMGVIPGNRYLVLRPCSYPNDDFNLCLNISTNDAPYNNANVNIYTVTGHNTQKWIMKQGTDGWWRLHTARNEAYALNVWRGSSNSFNADVYPWKNNLKDSAVASLEYMQFGYVLELQNYVGYELNTGSSIGWYSGQNVKWMSSSYSSHTWV